MGGNIDMAIYRDDRVGQLLRKHIPDGDFSKLDPTADEFLDIFGMSYARGTAFDMAASLLGRSPTGLSSQSGPLKVVDIGSGYGGTCMYLAKKFGFKCLAFELQDEIANQGAVYAKKLGLQDNISFEAGSITDDDKLEEVVGKYGRFDAAISILVLLHLKQADRVAAFRGVASLLTPKGKYYIECYCTEDGATMLPAHKDQLAQVVACPFVPTVSQYKDALHEAGFRHVYLEPLSDTHKEWKDFTTARNQAFVDNEEVNSRTFSEANFTHLRKFYATVAHLFADPSSALRGIRLVASL